MLRFTFNDFPSAPVEYEVVRRLAQDLFSLQPISMTSVQNSLATNHPFGTTIKGEQRHILP